MLCLNKQRRNFAIVVLWAVMWGTFCLGGPDIASATDETTPASKIHITAEQMVSNTKDRYAEFSGNVNAVQGDTTIRADALKIYYKEGANLEAGPKTQEDLIRQIVATGHVRITVADKTAYGEKAVYTSDNGLLVLTGNKARIESEGNYINGEKITLNRMTGQISVAGGADDRVEAVFESDNANGNTEKKTAP